MLRVDIEPLTDRPFHADLRLQSLPGLTIVSGEIGASVTRRTRKLLADGNDDLCLAVAVGGTFVVAQRERELALAAGNAVMVSSSDVATFTRPSSARLFGMRMPRAALVSLRRDIDDAVIRPIPRVNDALNLLMGYVGTIGEDGFPGTPGLSRLYVNHVYDVLGLAIGASKDVAALAEGRGLRAARLRAIKADVAAILLRPDLSVGSVAARHRVTSRYIQMLFRGEGTTFSDFVLDQRLARVHCALTDVHMADRKISTIVYTCGFGDLSHFNRAFRRRYGVSPSEVRNGALRID